MFVVFNKHSCALHGHTCIIHVLIGIVNLLCICISRSQLLARLLISSRDQKLTWWCVMVLLM